MQSLAGERRSESWRLAQWRALRLRPLEREPEAGMVGWAGHYGSPGKYIPPTAGGQGEALGSKL